MVKAQGKVTYFTDIVIQLGVVLLHSAKLDNAAAHIFRKLIAQRSPRDTYNGKLLRQQARPLQMKERRHQLAPGQVARGPKDHQYSRLRNPLATPRNL